MERTKSADKEDFDQRTCEDFDQRSFEDLQIEITDALRQLNRDQAWVNKKKRDNVQYDLKCVFEPTKWGASHFYEDGGGSITSLKPRITQLNIEFQLV
jgi:hypothetical protein